MGSRRPAGLSDALRPGLPAALAAILLALSFALYWPALPAQFVSDDVNAIVSNEHVRGPLDPAALFTRFSWWGATRGDAPGYRPLATLSFAINHAVGALDPRGYHAVNIALHALVSWLVFLLAIRLGLATSAAVAAAVVFCVLPIHTEPVAWVVGRAELMAAAAFAGALLALFTHRARGATAPLALAAALLLAGLFSKENAITLLAMPPVMAAVLPGTRAHRKRDLRAFAVLVLTIAIYFAIRASAGPALQQTAGDLLDNPLTAVSLPARIAGALSVLARYLALTVWPSPLSVDYSFDALGIAPGFAGDAYTGLGLLAVLTLAALAWRARSDSPAITFAILLTAVTYSIVSNTIVLIGTAMGERLFYLPSLGLCLLLGASLPSGGRIPASVVRAGLGGLVAAYGIVTFNRVPDWRTPVTLFEAAAIAQPRSARVYMELGSAYGHEGRLEDAVDAFRNALAIMPDYASAWYNLGNLYVRNGRYEDAAAAYLDTIEREPGFVKAWYNLGLTERIRGRSEEAAAAFRETARLAPHDPVAPASLGDTLLSVERYTEAVEAYDDAVERGSDDPAVLINRGVARQRSSGCAEAVDDYLAAERMSPGDPTAVSNAVGCLQKLGRHAEAAALQAAVANRRTGR
ncbi:MAG: tetratricopeptide repeat protein [Candidatus Binatia bacterium]